MLPGPPGGGRVSGEDARTPNSRPGMAEPGFLVFGSPQPVRWDSPEPLTMPTGHTGGAYSRIVYETVFNKRDHRSLYRIYVISYNVFMLPVLHASMTRTICIYACSNASYN